MIFRYHCIFLYIYLFGLPYFPKVSCFQKLEARRINKKTFSAPQPHSPGEQWEKTVNLKEGSYLWNSLWKKNQLWVCKEQLFRNTNIKNIASVIIVILAIVISHFPSPSSHIWNGAERENLSEFWLFWWFRAMGVHPSGQCKPHVFLWRPEMHVMKSN